ncbi:MAG TPA: SAM-dependent DNA methyltransferase, partial [Thermoprotei archaeon]|nr:SAM-dependent DNA methyltransferase [Thermoprotei archaeon]
MPIPKRRLTREELNSLVDRAADLIRTAVDYKFILVLLFLKRLNDVWKSEKRQVKERLMKEAGLTEEEAEEEAEKDVYHTFNIPKKYLWDEITRDVKRLPENLATSISEIAKINNELQGVINRVDFLEFARNQENRELLRQLVELFNKYDLSNEYVSPDVLGDAYEHILMRFAPEKAKEGEIYTPRKVIKLLVNILDP